MDFDFADIKIVSLEEGLTVESPERPSLFYVYLRLSQTPPPIWQTYFKESRKVSRHPHWRRAWVDRKYIIVECPPAEIETHHLNDLKQDIATANEHYRKYLGQRTDPDHLREKSHALERDRLREMKGRLNFD